MHQQHQRINIQLLNCNSVSFLFLFKTKHEENRKLEDKKKHFKAAAPLKEGLVQRPCSSQLPPERPAAAKTCRQTALQQTIAARETCSGHYNRHKWWRRPAPLPLLSPRSPLPHQPSPSSPSILLPISPLLYPPSPFTPITTTNTPATFTSPTLTTTTSYIPPLPPNSTRMINNRASSPQHLSSSS